jgi:hypothetical protein
MKKTRNRIPKDGYTRRGYIPPVKGLHEGMTFDYRLMLPEQVELLGDAMKGKSGKESTLLVAAAIAEQIANWSEVEGVDGAEKAVPVSTNAIRSLPRPLLLDLRDIVQGVMASAEPPDASDQETNEYIAALKASAEDRAPGQSQLTTDIKN